MNDIFFTVIIPLFNKEEYIASAIESVLNQTYKNFELIIVNDGSTDSSLQIAEKFKDPKIQLFSKNNSGESSARNFGIEKASGDFIAFLDADDEWLESFLSQFNQAIKLNGGNKFFAIGYYIKENNGVVKNINIKTKITYIKINFEQYLKLSLKKQIATSNTVAIHSSLVKEIEGFKVGLKRGPDRDYWLRIMLLEGNLLFINSFGAIYHREANNRVCNTTNISAKEDMIFNLSEYREKIHLKKNVKTLHQYLSYFALNRSLEFYRNKNFNELLILSSKICFSKYYFKKYLLTW